MVLKKEKNWQLCLSANQQLCSTLQCKKRKVMFITQLTQMSIVQKNIKRKMTETVLYACIRGKWNKTRGPNASLFRSHLVLFLVFLSPQQERRKRRKDD